jgi:hypothetical protein
VFPFRVELAGAPNLPLPPVRARVGADDAAGRTHHRQSERRHRHIVRPLVRIFVLGRAPARTLEGRLLRPFGRLVWTRSNRAAVARAMAGRREKVPSPIATIWGPAAPRRHDIWGPSSRNNCAPLRPSMPSKTGHSVNPATTKNKGPSRDLAAGAYVRSSSLGFQRTRMIYDKSVLRCEDQIISAPIFRADLLQVHHTTQNGPLA